MNILRRLRLASLKRALIAEDTAKCLRAFESVERMGIGAIPVLDELCKDPSNEWRRTMALQVLGKIRSPLAVPILAKYIDPDQPFKIWAGAAQAIHECSNNWVPIESLKLIIFDIALNKPVNEEDSIQHLTQAERDKLIKILADALLDNNFPDILKKRRYSYSRLFESFKTFCRLNPSDATVEIVRNAVGKTVTTRGIGLGHEMLMTLIDALDSINTTTSEMAVRELLDCQTDLIGYQVALRRIRRGKFDALAPVLNNLKLVDLGTLLQSVDPNWHCRQEIHEQIVLILSAFANLYRDTPSQFTKGKLAASDIIQIVSHIKPGSVSQQTLTEIKAHIPSMFLRRFRPGENDPYCLENIGKILLEAYPSRELVQPLVENINSLSDICWEASREALHWLIRHLPGELSNNDLLMLYHDLPKKGEQHYYCDGHVYRPGECDCGAIINIAADLIRSRGIEPTESAYYECRADSHSRNCYTIHHQRVNYRKHLVQCACGGYEKFVDCEMAFQCPLCSHVSIFVQPDCVCNSLASFRPKVEGNRLRFELGGERYEFEINEECRY
ncbi:MAG TPA: HEAT repeat domain-containing protein [Verrucomicrobiae bacterium]|nr:HEAT repeat domain-containing protein [Verrucomicrobiae bacterium]